MRRCTGTCPSCSSRSRRVRNATAPGTSGGSVGCACDPRRSGPCDANHAMYAAAPSAEPNRRTRRHHLRQGPRPRREPPLDTALEPRLGEDRRERGRVERLGGQARGVDRRQPRDVAVHGGGREDRHVRDRCGIGARGRPARCRRTLRAARRTRREEDDRDRSPSDATLHDLGPFRRIFFPRGTTQAAKSGASYACPLGALGGEDD